MRVLVVHAQHHDFGGEDVVVDAEIELLRSAGNEVAVHAQNNPAGGAAVASFVQAPWNLGEAHKLKRHAANFQPDVIHIHNTWFGLSPSVVRAATIAAPTVMTLHNYRLICADGTLLRDGAICTDCCGTGPWKAVRYGCYRASSVASIVAATTISVARALNVYDDVDLFIAPTELVKQHHIDAGVVRSNKIVVKPHFLNDDGPRTTRPSESNTFVWAGRIAAGKGVDRLIEAWRIAQPSRSILRIIGDGPLRSHLEREAPPNVEFVGFRPRSEVLAHLRAARAFVFVSEWLEPFGLVLIEAMMAGTPILGFDIGDTLAIVGPAGRFVRPGDAASLAGLFDTPADHLDELGAAARLRYTELFTPTCNLGELEATYERAIASHRN